MLRSDRPRTCLAFAASTISLHELRQKVLWKTSGFILGGIAPFIVGFLLMEKKQTSLLRHLVNQELLLGVNLQTL